MKRHPHPNPGLQILAFMLTIAAGLVVLFVPLMAEVKVSNDEPERIRYVTLLSVMGWSIFVPLRVPVALAGLPLLLAGRMRKWASVATAIGLTFFAFIGSVSIGWFYLPAAIVAFMALFSAPGRREASATGLTSGR